MDIIDLFKIGKSFESTVGEGTKSERARIPKNYSRIIFSQDIISRIESVDNEINFLVSGEIWCPDFQINVCVLKKFCDLNTNFNMSIITMARGKKFLAPLLNIDRDSFRGPTVAVLDNNFNILGVFEERPKSVLHITDFETIKLDYYKGKYLLDTTYDFLHIMNI